MYQNGDQNWFYSSLAQSAAAIIGLIGAMLLSRALTWLAMMRESQREFVLEFIRLRSRLKDVLKDSQKMQGLLKKNIDHLRPELDRLGPNVSLERQEMWREVTELEDELAAHVKATPALNDVINMVNLEDIDSNLDLLRQAIKESSLEQENPFRTIINELTDLAQECSTHRSRVTPMKTASAWLIGLLSLLSLVSVIIPLGFLYAGPNEVPKYLLLALFAIGMISLVFYMIRLLFEIGETGTLGVPQGDRPETP